MQQFYELVRELVGLGKDMTEVALEKVNIALQKYFLFLGRVSKYFVSFLAFTMVLFAIGVIFELKPVVSMATFLGGVAVFLWLVAAFPVAWAVTIGLEWGPVKRTFEWIGIVTLWIFFLSLYFYLVPVPLVGIPVILLITVAMAIASVVFGVGISTKFIALRLGIIFVVMTISFVLTAIFPSASGDFGKLAAWIGGRTSRVVEEITTPLSNRVTYHPELDFFDSRTGDPLVWYYQNDDDNYELFDAPGRHPRYRVDLEPITPEKVRELDRLYQEEMARVEAERLAEEKKLADSLRSARREAQAKADEVARALKEKLSFESRDLPESPVVSPEPLTIRVFVQAGTWLEVVLDQPISTETDRAGDRFQASLNQVVETRDEIIPSGTVFEGLVNQSERPGRLQGVASLDLTLTGFSSNDDFVQIQTDIVRREGMADNTTAIGATWGKNLILPPGTVLKFRLARDVRYAFVLQ